MSGSWFLQSRRCFAHPRTAHLAGGGWPGAAVGGGSEGRVLGGRWEKRRTRSFGAGAGVGCRCGASRATWRRFEQVKRGSVCRRGGQGPRETCRTFCVQGTRAGRQAVEPRPRSLLKPTLETHGRFLPSATPLGRRRAPQSGSGHGHGDVRAPRSHSSGVSSRRR